MNQTEEISVFYTFPLVFGSMSVSETHSPECSFSLPLNAEAH